MEYYIGAAIGYKLSDFRFELDSSFQRFLEKKTNHTYVVRGGISMASNGWSEIFPLPKYRARY
ncbi:hypothetical protein [Candidatus Protochlamydia amoebophila]|uniref:Uncharacterized protein n=1 Tax=Candidatus Protochlamydia amoebophila TaxID=362787 RepID=A0A0C1JV96_9BACT|nr:hypothetical protein [Candidatus Protochlamydia amoebophila]KIC71177.1 hypothetical protein DB44_EK00010 [Candidatus Protochlamydia amoebophila]